MPIKKEAHFAFAAKLAPFIKISLIILPHILAFH